MIGLSDKAAKANPTLAAWLDGAGLRVRRFAAGSAWATGPAILSIEEAKALHRLFYRDGLNAAQAIEKARALPEAAGRIAQAFIGFAATTKRGLA